MTGVDVLEGTENHQATVDVFENLQGRFVAHGGLADAEVGVVKKITIHN